MSDPRCGCCHRVLNYSAEKRAGVCDTCLMIALRPWEYQNDPDIDPAFVKRRVDGITLARLRGHRRLRVSQKAGESRTTLPPAA